MNHTQRICLYYALNACAPSTYLEVGCADGESLEFVTRECLSVHYATVIDTWGREYGGTGKGNHDHLLRRFCGLLRPKFEYLDGDSHGILPEMTRSFDLVHIDGDHSEQGGASDLKEGWRMTKPGGWLVFDDTFHPAHLYLREVFERIAIPESSVWFHVQNDDGGCSAMRKPE